MDFVTCYDISYQVWYMMERGHSDPAYTESMGDPHSLEEVGRPVVHHSTARADVVVASEELHFTIVED